MSLTDSDKRAIRHCAQLLVQFCPIDEGEASQKVLLVEGATDAKFYDRKELRMDNVKVINMDKLGSSIDADNAAAETCDIWHKAKAGKPNRSKTNDSSKRIMPNYKTYIKSLCKCFAPNYFRTLFREDIIKVATACKQIDKYDVYGIVDKDNDDGGQLNGTEGRLFITDTHDIETLLLYSIFVADEYAIYRIGGKDLAREDLYSACYLAHQLQRFREEVNPSDSQIKLLKKDKGRYLNFRAMMRDENVCKLNLDKMISYLKLDNKQVNDVKKLFDKNAQNDWSKPAFSGFINKLDPKTEAKLTKNTKGKPGANITQIPDESPWNDINGHDIAAAVMLVTKQFDVSHPSFEMALVSAYDVTKTKSFYTTKLGQGLIKASLIKEPTAI